MELLPYDTKDLLKDLDKEFPHKCPTVDMSDRDIWIYTGKRELIDFLFDLQQDLENKDKGINNVYVYE